MTRPRPTPRTRVTARGAQSRRRLVDAAREELVERGGVFEIDSVAGRADLSVGLIYRHFGSRAGLVVAVVDDFYGRLRTEALERADLQHASFAARERKRIELTVAFHYRDPLAPIILSNLHLDAQVAAEEGKHVGEMIAFVAAVVAASKRFGDVPKDRDATLTGAVIIGGLRHGIAVALGRSPRISQRRTANAVWTSTAAILGIPSEET